METEKQGSTISIAKNVCDRETKTTNDSKQKRQLIDVFAACNLGFDQTNSAASGNQEDANVSQSRTQLDFEDHRAQSKDNTSSPISKRTWAVLAACFVSLSLSAGLPFNMTALYVEFQEDFEKSNAETSLVQSVATGIFFFAGILNGILITRYGPRKVGIPAALVTSVGIGASFFATSLEVVIVTLGAVTGFGASAVNLCSLTIIEHNFVGKAKLLAISFGAFSTGFGSVIMTPLLELLIIEYGWRGCLLVLSAIFFNLIPCIAISKSPSISDRSGYEYKEKQSVRTDITNILKNRVFILFALGMSLSMVFLDAQLVSFITFFLFKGYTREQGSFFYLIMNILNAFFRFVPGFCQRVPHISSLSIPLVFSCVGSITLFCFPSATNSTHFVVLMCTFGFSLGGLVCSNAMTTVQIVGSESYPTAMGLMLTVNGIGHIAFQPLVGYFRDTTGSFDVSFYVCGGAVGCGSFILTIALWFGK